MNKSKITTKNKVNTVCERVDNDQKTKLTQCMK